MAIFASGFVCSYVTRRQWHSPQPSWLYVAAMNHLNVLSLFGTLLKTRFVKPFGNTYGDVREWLPSTTWMSSSLFGTLLTSRFGKPFEKPLAAKTNPTVREKWKRNWLLVKRFHKSEEETGWWSNTFTITFFIPLCTQLVCRTLSQKWRRNWLVVKHFHDHIFIPLCTQLVCRTSY